MYFHFFAEISRVLKVGIHLVHSSTWKGRNDHMPDNQDRSVTNRGRATPATASEVDTFLAELKKLSPSSPRGRLIFALDATASRQPTWDTACELQADMFREAGTVGSPARLLSRARRVQIFAVVF
jgi:hypothetical protein